jgi:hypothetical protein
MITPFFTETHPIKGFHIHTALTGCSRGKSQANRLPFPDMHKKGLRAIIDFPARR